MFRNLGWWFNYLNPEDYKNHIMTVLRINLPSDIKRRIIEIWLTKLDEEIKDVVEAELIYQLEQCEQSWIYEYIDWSD